MLEVLYKLLYQHEVVAEDFIDQTVDIQGGGTVLANKSPGHNIMVHLLNDTAMLKMVNLFVMVFFYCSVKLLHIGPPYKLSISFRFRFCT